MSSFSSLMALSRSQTNDQQASVQKALLDRQRKEQEQKKKTQEQERKQKELEQKLLLKHFEDEKKEKEKQRKREEEEKAREAARARRAEEQKNALLYGPKKASKMNGGGGGGGSSASSSQSRDGASRKKRMSDDEDDAPASLALTREELRERKLQAALKRAMGSATRSTISRTYHKSGGRLPGGAVDLTGNAVDAGSSSSGKSVRERLAAMPNTLTKLNTNKRDTRTIDEILRDRAKAKELKTLDGEEAKEFTDWFGDAKKDKLKTHATSAGTTPRSNTPLSSSSPLPSTTLKQTSVKRTTPPVARSLPPKSSLSSSASKATSRSGSADRERLSMSKTPGSSKLSATSAARPSSVPSFKKKRPRSPSPERYPAKRRASPPVSSRHKRREHSEELDDANVSNMIWEIMGKRRSDYVHDDIFSDEEDMEAGASDLEREEQMSARIAKREDLLAQEAEKRHEEEKRRRKKERDRGY